jgi:hypothetical protein
MVLLMHVSVPKLKFFSSSHPDVCRTIILQGIFSSYEEREKFFEAVSRIGKLALNKERFLKAAQSKSKSRPTRGFARALSRAMADRLRLENPK